MKQAKPAGYSLKARIRARRNAVQACYQWQMTGKPMSEVVAEFNDGRREMVDADNEYFHSVLSAVSSKTDEFDSVLSGYLDRPLKQVDPVERSILYIGLYELMYQPEMPWRAIINESVELARMFGAEQSHKYINGILDRIARQLRGAEVAASQA